MFMSVYDTEANSAAAYDKAKGVHDKELHGDPDDKLLMNYFGEITWTGISSDGDENCVKSSDFGEYFSGRMFYTAGNDRPQEAGAVRSNYKAWTAVDSFDSYTSSTGMGDHDDESFFFETFNDQADSTEANELALENTNLDPSASLIYNIVGEVVFDSSCNTGDDESASGSSSSSSSSSDEEPTSEESSSGSSSSSSSEESSEECENVCTLLLTTTTICLIVNYFVALYPTS